MSTKKLSLGQRIVKDLKKFWGLYLLLLIPLVYVFIFNYVPMYGVTIAFRRFNIRQGILGSPFVGLYHFQRFLSSAKAFEIIGNTLAISLYSLVIGFPLPIVLALGLTHMRHGGYRKFIQMISYAPHFLSAVVLVGLISQVLNLRFGIVNRAIMGLGGEAINFMGSDKYFRHVFVWSGLWQEAGYSSIIFISALASVDTELHEAAVIDGASIWKRITHIDIPSIIPTVVIMLILRMGSLFGVGFEKIFLMQNPLNTKVSEVIDTYVYNVGINSARPDFSFGAAVGLFQSAIGFVLVMGTNAISRKLTEHGLW